MNQLEVMGFGGAELLFSFSFIGLNNPLYIFER